MNNLKKFLSLIAFSEGTSTVKGSDNGYNVLYGGGLFKGYEDHPRQMITLPINGKPVTSSAAGRYQILSRYWDHYRKELNLKGGFTPENQDKIANQMIRECRALADIEAGRIEQAILKCTSRWASMPGNNYKQNPHKMDKLISQYEKISRSQA